MAPLDRKVISVARFTIESGNTTPEPQNIAGGAIFIGLGYGNHLYLDCDAGTITSFEAHTPVSLRIVDNVLENELMVLRPHSRPEIRIGKFGVIWSANMGDPHIIYGTARLVLSWSTGAVLLDLESGRCLHTLFESRHIINVFKESDCNNSIYYSRFE